MKKAMCVLAVLLLAAGAAAGLWLWNYYAEETAQNEGFAALRHMAFPPTDSATVPDISALRGANRDCVAWISVPGTEIDYPVMQSSKDPEFYLSHNFEKEQSSHGVPFLDARCSLGSSSHLILYGHELNDGTMFSPLLQYKDSDFMEQHRTIELYTQDGKRRYEVLWVMLAKGAYTEDEWSLFRSVELNSRTEFEETVRELSDRSLFSAPEIDPAAGGQLLTLVTCEYSQNNGRLAVVAYMEE